MTITLTPGQEKAIRDAIQAGLVDSVDEFIETAIEALPHREEDAPSRDEAVRRMREFGERYRLSLGEPVTRTLLHEGHRQ
jgi:Arc/MetJ-type ribon-helix-helix transcriptional regulator